MIKFSCATCGRAFSVADEYAGRRANCKSCGVQLVVPHHTGAESQPSNESHPRETSTAKRPVSTRGGVTPPPLPSDSLAAPQFPTNKTGNGVLPEAASTGKIPVRIRRLKSDAEQMKNAFHNFSKIRVQSAAGNPPDTYVIEYRIQSLARGSGGRPIPRNEHLVEIQLTRDYPHQSPKCRMLTPVFHPNIEPTTICVGDHWTAAERLTDLVIRIGEMLAYQLYNIKSPLDGEAAQWADLNRDRLPTDRSELRPPNFA